MLTPRLLRPLTLLFAVLWLSPHGLGQVAERELVIGTKEAPPFSMKDSGGTWTGLSIELWEAAASDLGVTYRYEEADLAQLIDGCASGRFDVAVAALSVTAAREAVIDFSHTVFPAGLGIAVRTSGGNPLSSALAAFISAEFLQAAGGLLLLLLAVGLVLWLCERGRNPQFGGGTAQGIGSGLWWSAVTMTTVGYGDKAPVSLAGRSVAVMWMFAGIILISGFTASIAASLTVGRLQSNIRSPGDLGRVVSGCVESSTGQDYLVQRRYSHRPYETIEAALIGLAAGEVEAVVHDRPLLRYYTTMSPGGVDVLPISFERQGYAFGLPPESPLREPLNRALLDNMSAESWQEKVGDYLGD